MGRLGVFRVNPKTTFHLKREGCWLQRQWGFCLTLCDPALLLGAASHRASASRMTASQASRLPGCGVAAPFDFLLEWSSGLSLDLGAVYSCTAHIQAQTSGLYTLFLLDPARRA